MTYRSTHSNGHPAFLSAEQVRSRLGGATSLPECVYDPELHTGPRRTIESAEQRAAREQVAREVCADCALRRRCGRYALSVRPPFGVWAGLTAAEIAEVASGAESREVA